MDKSDLFFTLHWAFFALIWFILTLLHLKSDKIRVYVFILVLSVVKSTAVHVLPSIAEFLGAERYDIQPVWTLFDPVFLPFQLLVSLGFGTIRLQLTYMQIAAYLGFTFALLLAVKNPIFQLLGIALITLIIREWYGSDNFLRRNFNCDALQAEKIGKKRILFNFTMLFFLISQIFSLEFVTFPVYRLKDFAISLFITKEIALFCEFATFYFILDGETVDFQGFLQEALIIREIPAQSPSQEPSQPFFVQETPVYRD